MHLLIIVILLPLLGAIVNGLLLTKVSPRLSHLSGVLPLLASFLAALLLAIGFWRGDGSAEVLVAYEWLQAGSFSAPLALRIDQLSLLMLLVVTGIGTLIHVFAGGYMHEEKRTSRFFCYLNLFIFMMLLLIMSENLLVMFVGWEGVGLCSYLLIGYWFTETNNAKAGMKAFIVNRIGDIGFLLAIFLTYKTFGTVTFSALQQQLSASNAALYYDELLLITLCLFIGACGKSAQLPLHVWLPDAMAGPTPVSALIHAATMVTAGIFMITRLNFMYVQVPVIMNIVAGVGAATALLAATIAITQNDIKKVLAYSTVSQLGFMVLACGIGAFSAAIFHLVTHACFKALLFLGAGSVIVATHHEQDMHNLGGLWSRLPITAWCFLVGVLAIIGFPALSGFFSKDEILYLTYLHSPQLWAIAAVAAFFTAFYMVRLFCLTFLGTPRHEHSRAAQETSAVMWLPLSVLAVLSVVSGALGIPAVLGGSNFLHHYLAPLIAVNAHTADHHTTELVLMAISTLAMACAALLAYRLYRHGYSVTSKALAARLRPLYLLSLHKYWLDELYDSFFVTPARNLALFAHRVLDAKAIDGIVNGLGQVTLFSAAATSYKMSGSLHRHALVFVLGLACAVLLVLF